MPLLENKLRLQQIKIFTGEQSLAVDEDPATTKKIKLFEGPLNFELAQYISILKTQYLTAKSEQFIDGELKFKDGTSTNIKLPVFLFPFDLRKASLSLLNEGMSETKVWGYKESASIEKLFLTELNVLTEKSDAIAKEQLSNDVLKWILENSEIKKALEP